MADKGTGGYAPVDGAELYYRDVGSGEAIVVIHGGPDFDHRYLLPDMDRLADSFRLIYYDQRGRGASRGEARLEEVGLEQCVSDLEGLRRHLGLDSVSLLGHSWGGIIAMRYATRHPGRTARLILLNTAPASSGDWALLRAERNRRLAAESARLDPLRAGYEHADPEAVAAFYRIDYATTFKRPEEADRLALDWTREEILSGRAIETRLLADLFGNGDFTLLPGLSGLRMPAIVIHGELDFIPPACSARIAEAIPGARLVVLRDSGHFSYVDAAGEVRSALLDFFGTA